MIAASLPKTKARVRLLMAAAAILGGLTATPPVLADPPRTLDSYTVFADQRATFHGKDEPEGRLNSGNMGVNADLATENFELTLLGKFIAAPDTSIAASGVSLNKGSSVWDVYANQVNVGLADASKNNGPTPFSVPLISGDSVTIPGALPNLPAFAPGGTDVNVAAGSTLSLAPGAYGAINVSNGATLALGDGVYAFEDFSAGNLVTIRTSDGTIVRVAKQLKLGINNDIVGSDLAQFQVRGDGIPPFAVSQDGIGARAAFLGHNQDGTHEIHGQFLVPYHWLTFGSDNKVFGRFWARGVHSDYNPDFNYRAPETVSGHKFGDANGNGSEDVGEGGLAGFTFYIDLNGSGQLDAGEPSAQSDGNGNWSIGPLYVTGAYAVREVGQAGFTCTYPGSCAYQVDLGSTGQDHSGYAFGNRPDGCVPQPGQDANCQPVVVTCAPQSAQDTNCQAAAHEQGRKVTHSARLRGPSGCVRSSSVRVSGHNIRKVRFTIEGRKKLKRTVRKSPFRIKVKQRQLKRGANRVTARVIFRDGKRKIKRLTVQRCGSRTVSPRFTG